MYCTPEDLRQEGVTEEQANDERLADLCFLVGQYIEVMVGQWFEPRAKTLRLDGSGGKILALPVFLIEPQLVKSNGVPVNDYTLYNRIAPEDDRSYPKIRREAGWPKGNLNIEIGGVWGYVDEDGDGGYITPPLIRLAAKKLAIMQTPLLGDTAAQEEKVTRGMIASETTDGHSYTLDRNLQTLLASRQFTGDAEIDQILERYSKQRIGLGLI
ncbi:MAG: hypothetical protein LBR71_01345 [Synergistaceae bacterium]|jgi:hypothetical protein|nr:hypothetical protein [Synergistaceae bacterium]